MDWIVSEEDRADIAAALDGDDVAYGRLIERYEAGVFAQMGRFSRDRGVVEELVQEVFVQVYYSLPKFRGDAPLLHWIRKIATRTGYRYWTRVRGDRMREEALAQWARNLPPPESQSAAQAAETLQLLLALLGPKDRLVLTLYYLEDCSAQEIAERMGWNATLVRVRVHRALAALRKQLSRYPELGGGHV